MATKKACRDCKLIYEGHTCPNCGCTEAITNFKGTLFVFDPEKSEVAQKLGIKKPGEYAIKVK